MRVSLFSPGAPSGYDPRFDPMNTTEQRGPYVFINGVYTAQARIPGLTGGDKILAVGDGGIFVGAVASYDAGLWTLGARFIVTGGVRTLLSDAVTQQIGGPQPNYGHFSPMRISADGSVLFQEAEPSGSNPRAWLYKAGVLTFLWNGPRPI
jgi:hypothetical protein